MSQRIQVPLPGKETQHSREPQDSEPPDNWAILACTPSCALPTATGTFYAQQLEASCQLSTLRMPQWKNVVDVYQTQSW